MKPSSTRRLITCLNALIWSPAGNVPQKKTSPQKKKGTRWNNSQNLHTEHFLEESGHRSVVENCTADNAVTSFSSESDVARALLRDMDVSNSRKRPWSGPLRCIAEFTHYRVAKLPPMKKEKLPEEDPETCTMDKPPTQMFMSGYSHLTFRTDCHTKGFFSPVQPKPSPAPFVILLRIFSSPWPFTLIAHVQFFLHRVAEWVNPVDVLSRRLRSVILALGSWQRQKDICICVCVCLCFW